MQTLRASYSSMEEFSLAMSALGWEANFKQLEQGIGNNAMSLCASENAAVMLMGFSRRNHHRAIPSAQMVTFGLLASPQASGRVANRVLDSESLLHIDSYHGMDAVIEPGFTGYTMAFSEERLAEIAELYELTGPDFAASTPGSERFPGPRGVAKLRSLLAGVVTLATNGELAAATNLLELELPAAVLSNWMGAPVSSPARCGNRALVVARALEYLDAYPQEAISVEQLCQVCACSMSTLERAFKERFSVSPKRYLVMSRLSGVRRTLLEGTQEHSIRHLAIEWGFWHMSQFAKDYRQQFGELPSETLAISRT